MAMVRVSCASGPSAPSDMPGVTKRLRISVIDFDLVDRDRRPLRIEIDQVAQRHRLALVHHLGVLLVGGIGIARDRVLQLMHRVALQRVPLAAPAIAIQATDLQRRIVVLEGPLMQGQHLVLDAGGTDARDPRQQPREILGAQRAGQAHGLEIVAAAVAADDRDAHLGDDLQQALVDRLLVARQALVQGHPRQQAAGVPVGDRRLGEVGVDRGRTDPDQHRDIVHVQAFARAHRDRAEAAQALAHQVTVHSTCGQDHRDRRLALRYRLVAQHDLLAALAHRVLRRGTDARDRIVQRARPGLRIERAGDRGGARGRSAP